MASQLVRERRRGVFIPPRGIHHTILLAMPFMSLIYHKRQQNSSASGSYRHVWSFPEYNGDIRVLKTLHYKQDFDSRNFERHRRDAVTMERLSFSNHIVDIHGYCSNSALVDYTRNGDLTWLHRQEPRPNTSKQDLLQIAHDVTAAIADLHEAGIVHADIKPNQFLNFEGKYKLNDFNRAHFVKRNVVTNETCGFTETHNVGAVRIASFVQVCIAGNDVTCTYSHFFSCFHRNSH